MVTAADQSEEETSAIGLARLLTYLHHEGYASMYAKQLDGMSAFLRGRFISELGAGYSTRYLPATVPVHS